MNALVGATRAGVLLGVAALAPGVSKAQSFPAGPLACPAGTLAFVSWAPQFKDVGAHTPCFADVQSKEVEDGWQWQAFGPQAGSMDQLSDVRTQCTPTGFAVTATLMRSSAYLGGNLKNVLWRPSLLLRVKPARPGVEVAIHWAWRVQPGRPGEASAPPLPLPLPLPCGQVTVRRRVN